MRIISTYGRVHLSTVWTNSLESFVTGTSCPLKLLFILFILSSGAVTDAPGNYFLASAGHFRSCNVATQLQVSAADRRGGEALALPLQNNVDWLLPEREPCLHPIGDVFQKVA